MEITKQMKATEIINSINSGINEYDGPIDYWDAVMAVREAYRLGANKALEVADSATWIHGTTIMTLKDTITLG